MTQLQKFSEIRIRVLCCQRAYLTDWSQAVASRPFWRLYVNRRRGAEIVCNGRTFPLAPDRMTLIPPNTPIDRRLRCPVENRYIHFTAGEPYDSFAGQIVVARFTPETGKIFREIFSNMRDAAVKTVFSCRETLGVTTLIYHALMRIRDDQWPRQPADARIRDLIGAIEADPSGACTNARLAGMLHLSENAFIRLFRENIGVSPQQYVIRRRIAKACILLRHTDRSIEQVAEETGFCDRNHFSRVFAKAFGLGPAGYRKLAAQDS